MKAPTLKKLLNKKEVVSWLREILVSLDAPIRIEDDQGIEIMSTSSLVLPQKYPVTFSGECLGWVLGNEKAATVAHLLNYLVNQDAEKRTLATETLEKYKEINLLYTLSGKISACLELTEIANLVLEEAQRMIQADHGSLMLVNEATESLEIVAAFGEGSPPKISLKSGAGIAADVVANQRAEVINDLDQDPRFIKGKRNIYALICVPLVIKNRVFGVINISHTEVIQYTAADLKLMMAIASQAAAAIENALLHESKLKEARIKSQLERYLAPQLVQAIINAKDDVTLKTGKKNITLLFSDIRNFTTKCEELSPETIVTYLNEYFSQMVEIIFQHEGTVNKFVGDMIVSMFGAPASLTNSEERAIQTAIAMQKQIKTSSVTWIRENFQTGIGISSGDVVVGNIGAPQHMDYTAIGDRVNLASRLQSLAEGGQILVSRSIYEATHDLFDFKHIGKIKVKGKKTEVEVFEVLY